VPRIRGPGQRSTWNNGRREPGDRASRRSWPMTWSGNRHERGDTWGDAGRCSCELWGSTWNAHRIWFGLLRSLEACEGSYGPTTDRVAFRIANAVSEMRPAELAGGSRSTSIVTRSTWNGRARSSTPEVVGEALPRRWRRLDRYPLSVSAKISRRSSARTWSRSPCPRDRRHSPRRLVVIVARSTY
jgi:hypothetical protein